MPSFSDVAVDPAADEAAEEHARVHPAAVSAVFHALGEPHRLAILEHLLLGEHRVVDLVQHLGLAQSTVSAHLACLRDCGLVTSRPQGRSSMFSVRRPALLVALLDRADALVDADDDTAATHDPGAVH